MKVKPIKLKRIPLSYLAAGEIFTLNGVKYIKLENAGLNELTAITTLRPIANIESVRENRTSLEEDLFDSLPQLRELAQNHESIRHVFWFTRESVAEYGHYMYRHLKDEWVVVSDQSEKLRSDEYLYVDRFCNIVKGNITEDKNESNSRHLNIRMLCAIDSDVMVYH